jgi:membrane-associated protein
MFNINHIIQHSGSLISLLVIAAVILCESGIPFGFFLPGDTLLFTAGFFAAQHYLSIYILMLVVIAAKIVGSTIGYGIGQQAGKKLFTRESSFFFRKDYLDSAESFYEKHGGKTVTLGQFLPVVRTFAPIVAGASNMNKRKFFTFNLLGAIIWGIMLPLLGFWLGHKIHNIDKYLLPLVIIATIFSFTPAAWHLFGKRENRKKIINAYKNRKTNKQKTKTT